MKRVLVYLAPLGCAFLACVAQHAPRGSGEAPPTGRHASAIGVLGGAPGYPYPWQAVGEDPFGFAFNLANGNLQLRVPLLRRLVVRSLLLPAMDAYYNHYSTLYVDHWELPISDDRITVTDSSHVTVRLVSLQPVAYVLSGGIWASQTAGVIDTLVKNGDGSYDLTMPQDRRTRGQDVTYHFAAAVNGTAWLAQISDTNSNSVTVTRNGSNQATSLTDSLSRTFTFTWTSGRVTSIQDPLGNTASLAYNGSSQLVTLTPPSTSATQVTYNTTTGGPSGTLHNVTMPVGGSITLSYTGTSSTDQPSGYSTYRSSAVVSLSGSGSSWSITANGETHTYTFNAAGAFISQLTPLGTLSVTRDAQNNATSTTDPNGVTTTRTFNTQNQATSTTHLGMQTTNTYDTSGTHLMSTSGLGVTATFTRDGAHNVTGVTMTQGTASYGIAYTLNAYGQHTLVTPTVGPAIGFGYDANGHQNQVTVNSSVVRTRANDTMGQPTSVVDHVVGSMTTYSTGYSYDGSGRVLSSSPPAGSYAWTLNGGGQPTELDYTPSGGDTMSPSSATSLGYNSSGDLTSRSYNGVQTNGYTYQ
jgi:YD repeat-containing protein